MTRTCDEPPQIPDHRLSHVIGRGSYGEVWLAENVMGAGRAVKVVRRDTFQSARPYEREYSAIRRYEPVSRKADGLVQVLHAGRMDEAGLFYYVMELADCAPEAGAGVNEVAGGAAYTPRTLAADLRRAGRLPVGDCIAIAVSLAGALTSLHAAGLAHRDIKPSNIIFVNGRAKLADIGLVSELGESRSFVGTEGYIPPEGPGTPGADLYSLGRVLYEAVTGFEQTRYPELPGDWIAQDEAGAMEFFEVVLRACEGDPGRRYQSGADMMADLALLQGGRSVRRVRQLEARVVVLKRWGVVALGLVVLTAAGAWLAQWQARKERQLREQQAVLVYEQALTSARASVHSEAADARRTMLESARLANRFRPGTLGPRNAAIAALARPGLAARREFRDDSGRTDGGGAAAFSPDFRLMTEVDSERRVTVRRVADGGEVCRMPELIVPEWHSLDFSPDNRWLIGQTGLMELRVWSLGEMSRSFTVARAARWQVASFSPDSGLLAIVWNDGVATVHELASGRERCAFEVMPRPARLDVATFGSCHVFAPDSGRIATAVRFLGSPDGGAVREIGRVMVHDLVKGERLHEAELATGVDAIDWSPQGEWVALAMGDGAVRRWQPGADRVQDWLEHDARALSVDFHPSGEWVVTSSWDSTTRIWNVSGGPPLIRLNGWGTGSYFSADGTELLHHDASRGLRTLYGFETSPVCRQLAVMRAPGSNLSSSAMLDAAMDTDGTLAVAGRDGLWLLRDGGRGLEAAGRESACVRYAADGLWSGTRNGVVVRPRSDPASGGLPAWAEGMAVDHLGVSADGKRAVFSTASWEVWVWKDGKVVPVPDGIDFAHVAISPDGRWAVGGGRAVLTRVWDLDAMVVAADLPGEGAWVHVAFSGDGRKMAAGDARGLRVYEVPGFRLLWESRHREPGGFAVRPAFSADSRMVAATMEMRQPWLLDAGTGEALARLDHPFAEGITQLCFSPDSRRLAVLGTRSSVFLWDLAGLRAQLETLGMAW